MAEQETTLPLELLQEVAAQIDGDYTLQEIDDTAMWAASGPVLAASTAGLASSAEHTVYYAAGIFAGSMLPTYVNDGLLDPHKISQWVNEVAAKAVAESKKSKKKK